jgi:putative FmdB family regulatory protein
MSTAALHPTPGEEPARQYSLDRRDLAQAPWAFEGQGGAPMPAYEYYCDKCRGDVTVTLPITEHDKAKVACPQCGSTALRPLVSTFFSQTSRKS